MKKITEEQRQWNIRYSNLVGELDHQKKAAWFWRACTVALLALTWLLMVGRL